MEGSVKLIVVHEQFGTIEGVWSDVMIAEVDVSISSPCGFDSPNKETQLSLENRTVPARLFLLCVYMIATVITLLTCSFNCRSAS